MLSQRIYTFKIWIPVAKLPLREDISTTIYENFFSPYSVLYWLLWIFLIFSYLDGRKSYSYVVLWSLITREGRKSSYFCYLYSLISHVFVFFTPYQFELFIKFHGKKALPYFPMSNFNHDFPWKFNLKIFPFCYLFFSYIFFIVHHKEVLSLPVSDFHIFWRTFSFIADFPLL